MIHLSKTAHDQMLMHAQRKLRGEFYPHETHERKAFGILGGHTARDHVEVIDLITLFKNSRPDPHYRATLDPIIDRLSVPSETPSEKRGWIADSVELLAAQKRWESMGVALVGSYHTHRVPWASDPLRETCTALDRALSLQTGLWIFIVSMVNPVRPVIRAFFEADNNREAEVVVT